MFYLMTHSTHFILWLYDVGHMVKDHSDSERGNLLPPHGLLFPINSKDSFICTIPTDRIAYTTAFVTPVVEHWLEQEIDKGYRDKVVYVQSILMGPLDYFKSQTVLHKPLGNAVVYIPVLCL